MEPVPTPGDAFGLAVLDAWAGVNDHYVIERDDGMVDPLPTAELFSTPDAWGELDLAAMDLVSGRVLDVGAGAGRHSLALQARGDEPMALDTSAGALAVCQDRGVDQVFLGTVDTLADEDPEPFDAAILMGNNLALLESAERAPGMLASLGRLLDRNGFVVGIGMDPYLTEDPLHLGYHRWNRERDRFAGQIRMRVRYRNLAGPWFDYLFLSPAELQDVVTDAGWRVEDISDPVPHYLAVLRR